MNRPLKIAQVLTIPCDALDNFIRITDQKVSCRIDESYLTPCSLGKATLDISTETVDGNTAYKATLVMNWCLSDLPKRRMAYFCKQTDGTFLVLGTPLSPFPLAAWNDKRTRQSDRQSSSREVTVTWTDRFPPSELV